MIVTLFRSVQGIQHEKAEATFQHLACVTSASAWLLIMRTYIKTCAFRVFEHILQHRKHDKAMHASTWNTCTDTNQSLRTWGREGELNRMRLLCRISTFKRILDCTRHFYDKSLLYVLTLVKHECLIDYQKLMTAHSYFLFNLRSVLYCTHSYPNRVFGQRTL